MNIKKLTTKQQDLLDAVKGGARVLYMPYLGYFFRSDTFCRCTNTTYALIRRNFVYLHKDGTVHLMGD